MAASLVSPLDYRYGRPEMKRLFTEDARLANLLRVVASLANAQATLGHIPQSHAKTIGQRARDGSVTTRRVKQIEAKIRHDLMAVVQALAERCGAAGGSIHIGATSYDIIDTANAILIRDALDVLEATLKGLLGALVKRARQHKNTIMMGRTHGQAAVPTTFGYKLIVFADETGRHLQRLAQMRPRVQVGKMSGAVGTAAGFGPDSTRIRSLVMKDLGLGAEEAATQIVQRDRYVELFAWLANVATSMEKFSTEVRNLQRTELAEAAEGFDASRQVGSSTMPQKRNPIDSEQISGLARLVRAQLTPVMENAVQWHERDLANSAPERFLFPYTFILSDWIVDKMARVFENLVVDAKRMRANIDATGGAIMAESLTLALTRAGTGRQAAHEVVRRISRSAEARSQSFTDCAMLDPTVKKTMDVGAIKRALDPARYVGQAPKTVERVAARLTRLAR